MSGVVEREKLFLMKLLVIAFMDFQTGIYSDEYCQVTYGTMLTRGWDAIERW